VALGGLLEAVVADLGLARRLAETRALLAWDETVGGPMAQHARPLRLQRGRLEVAVASAAWRTQLSFMHREIVARLNQAAGETVIGEMVLLNRR
jgi:predicted nucleic acid-binding Zn ribbon protein